MDKDTFWAQTKLDASTGCIEWLGKKFKGGYGSVYVYEGVNKRKTVPASRWAYMLHHNIKLKRHEYVCHSCDNPGCVNVMHLFVGDAKINMGDCIMKDRRAHNYKYHHRHKTVTHETVEAIRQSTGLLKDIANKYGVSISYVSRIRNGKQKRQLLDVAYNNTIV